MDRQGIIAVVLAGLVLALWTVDNSRRAQLLAHQKAVQAAAEAAEAATHPAPADSATPPPEASPASAGAPASAMAPEQITPAETPSVAYAFTNLGGGIQRARLKKHQAERGEPVTLNQFGEFPIGALSEKGGLEARQPYTLLDEAAGNIIHFQRTDARQLSIDKKFILPTPQEARDEYLATLEVTFTNRGPQPLEHPSYFVYAGSAAPIHQIDQVTFTGFGWMPKTGFQYKDANSFTTGWFFNRADAPTFQQDSPEVAWAGVTNQYFSTIVIPLEKTGSGAWAHKFAVKQALIGHGGDPNAPAATVADERTTGAVDAALAMPGFPLAPGASQTQRFEIYTGPREYNRLKALGHGEDEIMAFGTFKIVSKVLLNSLNWLHSKLGSYAAAIIVLTICIRSLMWPLQNKGTQSMKKMQAVAPRLNELKEKYKDDPARLNQETMKLYKENGINPLSGCLPMVVQIPIFFGFYNDARQGGRAAQRAASFGSTISRRWIPSLDSAAQPAAQHPAALHGGHDVLADEALAEIRRRGAAAHVHVHAGHLRLLLLQVRLRARALLDGAEPLLHRAALPHAQSTSPVLQKVAALGKKR